MVVFSSDLDRAPPDPCLRASVVVPARNEADQILVTLAALADQRDRRGGPLDPRTFEVLLLANNCADSTAELARRFARDTASRLTLHVVEHHFDPDQANVGSARRWLMDQACARLEAVGQPRGLIASTDADTRVNRDWVTASLREIDRGADAVAGMIRVDVDELRRIDPRLRRLYLADLVYRRLRLELETLIDFNPFDPAPRHDFHGGASLGITPDRYRAVGGLPPLACLEDVALTAACWLSDARFIHSSRVRVRTSARLVGRTAGGYSQALARWTQQEDQPLVVDVPQLENEWTLRQRLRQVFVAKSRARGAADTWFPDNAEIRGLADQLGIEAARLRAVIRDRPTFGAWVADLKPGARDQTRGLFQRVPLDQAISHLRARIRGLTGPPLA